MRDRIRAALTPTSPRRASAAATGRCPGCRKDFEDCTCVPKSGRARQHPDVDGHH